MEFGLQNRIAIITGTNNPQGIGAATALALANKGVRLALIYEKIPHKYAESKTDSDGLDRYFKANSSGSPAYAKPPYVSCDAMTTVQNDND
jgi:3-oxoacyl-[acyl-carrier protein] reductase